jgi:hypothetical protein
MAGYGGAWWCLRYLHELGNEVQRVLRPDIWVYREVMKYNRTTHKVNLISEPGICVTSSFRVQMLGTCT